MTFIYSAWFQTSDKVKVCKETVTKSKKSTQFARFDVAKEKHNIPLFGKVANLTKEVRIFCKPNNVRQHGADINHVMSIQYKK